MDIEFSLRENEDYIPLIQLLKAVNIASSGSQAQMMVINGDVKLNNETEFRKRAKIRREDVVLAYGKKITVK
ncbi:MAG: RNA-binding S4 domain-containing protein [Bacteroidales bacterium]|jgi:ribosome-associated protein|nr:RNA-binding S4 domain-containing protein [Bacteroidales bacterium]